MVMEENEKTSAVFVLDTTDPKVVTITLSDLGQELVGDDAASTFEDLMDNIDQNFRTAGFMYELTLLNDGNGIEIRPFEDGDDFTQEVFNLIAEELDFMDSLVNNQDEEEVDL